MLKIQTYVLTLALATAAFGFLPVTESFADHKDVRKVAIHVNEKDPKKMNMALNNAENVYNYYKSKGQKVEVRVVAYGPGLHMLRSDTSPVKARVERMALRQDGLSFAACGNTHRKMSEKEGKKPPIMSEAKMVTAGVVELMELQMHGWTYIRP